MTLYSVEVRCTSGVCGRRTGDGVPRPGALLLKSSTDADGYIEVQCTRCKHRNRVDLGALTDE